MATTITMKAQKETQDGRMLYVHINPDTGKTDSWGLVVDETPDFREGGVA